MALQRHVEAEYLENKNENYRRKEAMKSPGGDGVLSAHASTITNQVQANQKECLMEEVVKAGNLREALRQVVQNRGAAGIDGMTVDELKQHLNERWTKLKEQLLDGTYQPQPVRQVEIPKPGGGVRKLGIPTVVDRFIQQALLGVLAPIFERTFSPSSYGFRRGKSAHQAVNRAYELIKEGRTTVVDIDIEKFFDCVNHDILMSKVMLHIKDKRILRLIRRFLESGILINGCHITTDRGTPQGGPLSPLLANILLNDLDRELEKRGHKFARYADDSNIYVRSRRAGERIMASISNWLQKKLKLKINSQKSAVDEPSKRKFLGFTFRMVKGAWRIQVHEAVIARFKDRVRELTKGHQGKPLDQIIKKLNEYLIGWRGYFSIAEDARTLSRLEGWIRRRLRMCLLKQWKRCKTKLRNLVRAGASHEWAMSIAYSRKKHWCLSKTKQMNTLFGIKYWSKQGLAPLLTL